MKKIIIPFLALIFLAPSCCDDKKNLDACDLLPLADLVYDVAKVLLDQNNNPIYINKTVVSQNANEKTVACVFDYINDGLNLANALCSCKDVANTGDYINGWNIYFSSTTDDPPGGWGAPIKEETVDKSDLLACQEEVTGLTEKFLTSGYYLIEIILDNQQNVSERNEGNNGYDDGNRPNNPTFESNKKFGNNRYYTIIKVDLESNPIQNNTSNTKPNLETIKVF